jgi:uncharacterized protein (DUF433 family)
MGAASVKGHTPRHAGLDPASTFYAAMKGKVDPRIKSGVTGERRIRIWYIAKFLKPRAGLCGKSGSVNAQNHPRIVVDPALCGGRPTVRGTSFAVADIIRLLADGDTEETLAADFPPLTVADVRACRAFAAATGMTPEPNWIDRFAGTLDEDFARGALDPWPEEHGRRDTNLG